MNVLFANEDVYMGKAVQKTLRIPRPYGGAVIFEAESRRGLAAFFRRTSNWFDTEAAIESARPLPLFADEPQHVRELTEYRAAAKNWPFEGDVHVSYEPPQKSAGDRLPAPVPGAAYRVAAGIERRAVSSFVLHARANDGLRQSDDGLVMTYQERSQFVDVELRDSAMARVRDAAVAKVRAGASSLSGVAEDVLDILIANAFYNHPNSHGMYAIDIDGILDVRSKAKKRKADGAKVYSAGHHQEARRAVALALIELSKLWVAMGERKAGRGRRPAREWQGVLFIDRLYTAINGQVEQRDRTTLEELEPDDFISFEYGFGSWFLALRENAAFEAPKQLLELDANRQGSAKELGRYLLQRQEANNASNLVKPISDFFRDLVWKPDLANPGKTRKRIERALDTLVENKILRQWGYVENATPLPVYGWFPVWMDRQIWVAFRYQ